MMSLLSRVGSGRISTPATQSTNNNTGNDAIIESISCPITGMPMTDPVQGTDGHTYERSAIEELVRKIEQQFEGFGSSTSTLFGGV